MMNDEIRYRVEFAIEESKIEEYKNLVQDMVRFIWKHLQTMSSSADLKQHKLTKFFLAISIFITAISVLAVYSTTMGAEYRAQPSWQQPRPQLMLSELIPGQYVFTTARIAYVKTSERTDALGTKLVFTRVLEDSMFKAPFVSHRISYLLIRNSDEPGFNRTRTISLTLTSKRYWLSTLMLRFVSGLL